jgi:hypothetical protein
MSTVRTHEHNPSADAQQDMSATLSARNDAIERRNTADGSLDELRREFGLTKDDLSSENLQTTVERLRRDHSTDEQALAKITELERRRVALASARDDVAAASERLGNQMAVDYMRSAHSNAQLLYGHPEGRGRPGEFDFVYISSRVSRHSAT